MANPVVHFEITGPDGSALQQFYRDLFDWNIDVMSEDMGNYGLVQTNEGGIGGGISQNFEDSMPNYITVYVEVDDLQTALDKASELGGAAAMPQMEIAPGMGSIAGFTDPANNFIGLYALPSEWNGEMPPKGNAPPVVHFEVGGDDAEALESFYTQMFDWQINYVPMEDVGGYRLVQAEGYGIGGGIFQHMEGMPPSTPSVAVQVDDLQAYLDKAVSLGGKALMQPHEIPGGFGSLAIFYDIAGNRISLFKTPENHTHPHS